MNSNQIELLAVNAVEDYFTKIERINPTIPVGDKEPSWDGFLYLYSDNSMKKDSLIGRIPVQVKGKQGEFVESLTYPVKTSDLRNYMREGGCIYFVVLINDKQERKIFHREAGEGVERVSCAALRPEQGQAYGEGAAESLFVGYY